MSTLLRKTIYFDHKMQSTDKQQSDDEKIQSDEKPNISDQQLANIEKWKNITDDDMTVEEYYDVFSHRWRYV